jgi:hypothetical protein
VLDPVVKPIEILRVLHVPLNRGGPVSEESDRHLEFVLPAAGDVDECPFPRKPLRRREPEATAAACNYRYFVL